MATKADTVLQSYLLQSLNMALGALMQGGDKLYKQFQHCDSRRWFHLHP